MLFTSTEVWLLYGESGVAIPGTVVGCGGDAVVGVRAGR